MSESRKLRVFLCCTSQDKPFVHDIYDRLEGEEWIDPWLDDEKLLPGMNWKDEVEKAVGDSDCIIICLSKAAIVENKSVARELRFVLNHALENSRRSTFIIPLRLDDCQLPRHIQSWQYHDFSIYTQRDKVCKRLVNNLQIRANLDPKIDAPSRSAHFVSASNWQETFGTDPEILRDFNFVEIPAGKFWMGSKAANPLANEDEFLQHPCHIPYDYQITRFPITNKQFGEFVISTRRSDCLIKDWRSKPNQPAVNISWYQAMSYVNWLNKTLGMELERGLVFRLPTEAEWERAARGDFGREWPWGNESLDRLIDRELLSNQNNLVNEVDADDYFGSDEVSDFFAKVFRFDRQEFYKVNGSGDPATARWKYRPRVNYTDLRNKIADLRSRSDLVDVGSFSPITDSPFKIADMMGNIIEWTQSLYEPYPYTAEDGRENLGGDGKRVVRGLFTPSKNDRFSVRCAKRFSAFPHERACHLGFRIVIAPPIS